MLVGGLMHSLLLRGFEREKGRERERQSEKRERAGDHGLSWPGRGKKALPSTFPEVPARSSFSFPVLQ